MVFASEFFEHIERPIEYLSEVFEHLRPRVIVTANSFSARAIGHFEHFVVGDRRLPGADMSREFGASMRRLSYSKVETGFWNNRPAVWKRA